MIPGRAVHHIECLEQLREVEDMIAHYEGEMSHLEHEYEEARARVNEIGDTTRRRRMMLDALTILKDELTQLVEETE